MKVVMMLYMFVLFVALTPGVLVNLPPRCSKYVVLATHAVIFAAVWHFTHRAVSRATEGFASDMDKMGSGMGPKMGPKMGSGMGMRMAPKMGSGMAPKMEKKKGGEKY